MRRASSDATRIGGDGALASRGASDALLVSNAVRRRTAAMLALASAWCVALVSACARTSDDTGSEATPSTSASKAASTPAETTVVVARHTKTLTVHHARELETLDLSGIVELDLALSELDQIGRLGDAEPELACDGLDLAAVTSAAPALERLRISGCAEAIAAGFGSASALRELELADLSMTAGVVESLARLSSLRSLTLSRVEADAPLRPLAALDLERLTLADLTKDSDLAELAGMWPKTLEALSLVGNWAGHDAMLQVAKAARLEVLELQDTRVGNFSLNQIKGLPRLRELVWRGATFNDMSPLYFRDLPIERFVCACPRLGDAGVKALRHSEGIRHVELPQSEITTAGMEFFTKLPHLESLVLLDVDVGPGGFEALSQIPGLKRLELAGTLEHPRLENLGKLAGLRELRLGYPTLDDRAAAEIGKLAALEVLDLGGTRIADVGLEKLEGLTALRVLELHHTRVTNRGLAHLGKLIDLEVLTLDHTDVVDAGVAHLAGLVNLRELRLDATLVTDAAIDALLGLVSLERLDLSDTVVTSEGVRKLRNLPKLRVLGIERTRASVAADEPPS